MYPRSLVASIIALDEPRDAVKPTPRALVTTAAADPRTARAPQAARVLKVKRDRGDASAALAISGFFSSAAAEDRVVAVMIGTIKRASIAPRDVRTGAGRRRLGQHCRIRGSLTEVLRIRHREFGYSDTFLTFCLCGYFRIRTLSV